jgi:hypothetical protein
MKARAEVNVRNNAEKEKVVNGEKKGVRGNR